MNEGIILMLLNLFQNSEKDIKIPNSFSQSSEMLILKPDKGYKKGNYRPIS